jgi:osmotically-inducible protein OsmY
LLTVLAAAAITVGCGPSDATINTNVKEKLSADDAVKTAAIEASTQKKVVTLSGTVDAEAVKERAVTVARQVDGVADVVDQIKVQSAPGPDSGHEMMKNGMKMEKKEHGEEAKHQ